MSAFTPLQWRQQLLKIISTTAALWGLGMSHVAALPMLAQAEKAGKPLGLDSAFQLTRP